MSRAERTVLMAELNAEHYMSLMSDAELTKAADDIAVGSMSALADADYFKYVGFQRALVKEQGRRAERRRAIRQ